MVNTEYNTSLVEMLEGIRKEEHPLAALLKAALQEIMEAEITEKLRASKSERSSERTGFRSGHRKCNFDTLLGTVELDVPKVREGGYVPFFKSRRQRCDEALITAVQDMYISGVSTRKVTDLVKHLGIENISAAEISEINKRLDEEVARFRNRSLDKSEYPILWVDALYENVRIDERVESVAVEVVCGVNADGYREVLAIEPMSEESKDSYLTLFRKLKERGLRTPKLVISDAHPGLAAAIKAGFPGASWQRCKVHFMRNILSHIPKRAKESVGAELRQIWLQPDREQAELKAKAFIETNKKKYPEAAKCLEDGLSDSLTFYAFPSVDPKKIASSNMIERLNREIRRRTSVVGVFPNTASYVRLVTCYIKEYTDEWSSGHAYINKKTLAPLLTAQGAPGADA